jgi:hypothetical protein
MAGYFLLPFGTEKQFIVTEPGECKICVVMWKNYKRRLEEKVNFQADDVPKLLTSMSAFLGFFDDSKMKDMKKTISNNYNSGNK